MRLKYVAFLPITTRPRRSLPQSPDQEQLGLGRVIAAMVRTDSLFPKLIYTRPKLGQ